MAFRVGDFSKYNSISLLIQRSTARMSNLQIQAATGRAGETYADIATQSSQALRLENSYMKTKRYQDNITLADQKIDQYEASISEIQEVAEAFKALLTTALNANNADFVSLGTQATTWMQGIQAQLNKQTNGQYIFSGTMSSTAPVDITRWGAPITTPTNYNAPAAYTVPTVPATPTTFPVTIGATATSDYFGHFMGNTTVPSVRADDNLSVQAGLTAADPAFGKLLYALRLAATASAAPADERTDRLNGAMTVMNEVIGNLADARSSIGAKGRLLLDTKSSHEAYLSKVEDLVQSLQSADIPLTMAKLSAEQTQLEASFMTISRLNQVSLVRFMQ